MRTDIVSDFHTNRLDAEYYVLSRIPTDEMTTDATNDFRTRLLLIVNLCLIIKIDNCFYKFDVGLRSAAPFRIVIKNSIRSA